MVEAKNCGSEKLCRRRIVDEELWAKNCGGEELWRRRIVGDELWAKNCGGEELWATNYGRRIVEAKNCGRRMFRTRFYRIYRDDPCEFCLCLDGEMFCWWQDCPPTLEGPCRDRMPFSPCSNGKRGRLYKMQTKDLSISTPKISLQTSSEQPLDISEVSSEATLYSSVATETEDLSTPAPSTSPPPPAVCTVMGKQYQIGASLPHDTGNCVECVCGQGAQVTCSPHQCAPSNDDLNDYRPPGARPQPPDVF